MVEFSAGLLRMVRVYGRAFNIPAAVKYASENLFDSSGNPEYLPAVIAMKADAFYDSKNKPPKSYVKILADMKAAFNATKND